MKSTIRFGLGLAGMDEVTITEIDKALPAVERLMALLQKNKPDLQEAYTDLLAVLPAAQKVIAFIKEEK